MKYDLYRFNRLLSCVFLVCFF